MTCRFSHEQLTVYKEAINFVAASEKIISKVPVKHSVRDQLERASTSIPLNIAEGNGKFTTKDKCRFLDMARGSALECAACLDVICAKGLIPLEDIEPLRRLLDNIVAMIVGLIRSISDNRTH